MPKIDIGTRIPAAALSACMLAVCTLSSCVIELPDPFCIASCGSTGGPLSPDGREDTSDVSLDPPDDRPFPSPVGARAKTRSIAADALQLRYEGRWSHDDSSRPRCGWSGCAVFARFDAARIGVRLSGDRPDFVSAIVDDNDPVVLALGHGEETFQLASNLDEGMHTVRIMKRTEANVGDITFLGFEMDDARPLQEAPAVKHRIEVIGDSITCGYGDIGEGPGCGFSPDTEDGTRAYGALTAHALGAAYTAVSWSGKGIYRNLDVSDPTTIPLLYDKTLPYESDDWQLWDFSQDVPDVVVINLGTNDFSTGNPPKDELVATYLTFLGRIRDAYPDAKIVVSIGPMLSDFYPDGQKTLSTARNNLQAVVAAQRETGDAGISYLEYDVQRTGS